MKLGCTIFNCNQGNNMRFHKYDESVPLNIRDLRPFNIFPTATGTGMFNGTEEKLFFILSPSEHGACLGVIFQVQGDRNPYNVAWIHIHKSIINHPAIGDGLLSIVKAIIHLFSSKERMDYTELEQLLDSKDYPQLKPCEIPTCEADSFAVKPFRGEESLQGLLSQLYQPELFAKFKAIFFVERECGISWNSAVRQLSDSDFKSYVLINQEIIRTALNLRDSSISILDKSGAPFQEFWQEAGRPYEILLKKGFFDPLPVRISADSRMTPPILFSKRVGPQNFKVTDETGKELYDCTIKYNNHRVDKVAEEEFNDPSHYITISRPGFELKKVYLRQLSTAIPIPITLVRETNRYTFKIPKRGNDIELTVQTTEPITTEFVPIEGYIIDEDPSLLKRKVDTKSQPITLKYDRFGFLNSWKFLVVAVIIFLLNFGIGCMVGAKAFADKAESTTTTTTQKNNDAPVTHNDTSKGPDTTTNQGMSNGCDYLDKKKKWNRSEMEEINDLKGFWDALNMYDFDKLSQEYSSKLSNSTRYKDIINRIPTEKVTPGSKFNSDGDFNITPESYLRKLQSFSTQTNNNTNNNNKKNNNNNKNNTNRNTNSSSGTPLRD